MSKSDYFPISLPSGCIPYKVDPDTVKIRPYCGEDQIILSTISVTNLDKKFMVVLDRVLKGINPKDLTLGDRFYIMIWEYINSYTNIVGVNYVCSYCLNEVKVQVDLTKLDTVELSKDFKFPYPITLSDGKQINLRLFNVGDAIAISEYKQDDVHLYQYARTIVDDRTIEDKVQMLKDLSTKDLALIYAFHEKFFHGLNMNTKVECPKCKAEAEKDGVKFEPEEIEVPFRLGFLFPTGSAITDAFGSRI
jgi:hypothetical protein